MAAFAARFISCFVGTDLVRRLRSGDVGHRTDPGPVPWALERERVVSELSHRHPGLEVRAERTDGPAADVLAAAGRSAELLVLGSRGLGRFQDLLLGSVALETARRAPCPVVLLPGRRLHGRTSPGPNSASTSWSTR
ncbi:universal stress protein [Streptomyces sp.]